MKVSKRLKREAKEHFRGKFALFIIFILIAVMFISYKAGETAGSVEICINYAYRYLTARGINIQMDLDQIHRLLAFYRPEFEEFIDLNYTEDCTKTRWC